MPSKNKPANYFIFSIEYLVLVGLIYSSFIICPFALVGGAWEAFFVSLLVILVCLKLLNAVLIKYFIAAKKTKSSADTMTVISIFPPIIGPAIVLYYSLESTS